MKILSRFTMVLIVTVCLPLAGWADDEPHNMRGYGMAKGSVVALHHGLPTTTVLN